MALRFYEQSAGEMRSCTCCVYSVYINRHGRQSRHNRRTDSALPRWNECKDHVSQITCNKVCVLGNGTMLGNRTRYLQISWRVWSDWFRTAQDRNWKPASSRSYTNSMRINLFQKNVFAQAQNQTAKNETNGLLLGEIRLERLYGLLVFVQFFTRLCQFVLLLCRIRKRHYL